MPKSLLELVPSIVAEGRQDARHILESLESRHRPGLRTREWVLTAADGRINDAGRGRIKDQLNVQPNRLIQGDNLPAMAALLAGDGATPSLRGHIDLIYVEPPSGPMLNCWTASGPPGFEHARTVIKGFSYSEVWVKNIASYLATLAPRLILMRELLSDAGSICLHLDWHVAYYTKIMMDEIFNKDKFAGQIIRYYPKALHEKIDTGVKTHRIIFQYTKSENAGGKIDVRAWHAIKQTANPAKDGLASDLPHGCMQNDRKEELDSLLERIIKTSSHEGSVIADFFNGSGTTAEVAAKLGRRWIASDPSESACLIARRRLKEQHASSFLYQTIGID